MGCSFVSSERRTRLLAGSAIVAIVLPLASAFRDAGAPMDEGLLLAYPTFVLEGLRPGVDFLHPYGPGNLWLLAGIFRVFGASLTAERSVGLAARLAIVAATFMLTRSRGCLIAGGAAVMAAWLIAPLGLGSFAWFGALSFALPGLVLLQASSRDDGTHNGVMELFAGVLGGLATVWRPDMIVAIFVGAAVALFPRDRRTKLLAILGFIVGAIPLALFVASIGAGSAYRSMFLEPAARAGALLLPIPPRTFETAWLFAWTVSAALIATLVPLRRAFRARRLDRDVAVEAAIGIFSIALVPQMLQRADNWHVTYVGCVAIPAALPFFVEGWRRLQTNWLRSRATPIAVASLLALVFVGAPTLMVLPLVRRALATLRLAPAARAFAVSAHGREFLIADGASANDLTRLIELLDARARVADRLFVGAATEETMNYNDAYVYYLVPDLRPASYMTAISPGSTVPPADLRTARFLLLSTYYDVWFARQPPGPSGPEMAKIVANDFVSVGSAGRYELFERREASTTPAVVGLNVSPDASLALDGSVPIGSELSTWCPEGSPPAWAHIPIVLHAGPQAVRCE